jgi:hypothetical protein
LILDGGRSWLRRDGGGRGGQRQTQRQHDQRPMCSTHDAPKMRWRRKGGMRRATLLEQSGAVPGLPLTPTTSPGPRPDSTPPPRLHTEPAADEDAVHHFLDTSPRWPPRAPPAKPTVCPSPSFPRGSFSVTITTASAMPPTRPPASPGTNRGAATRQAPKGNETPS